MFNFIIQRFDKFGITRYTRIKNYLSALDSKYEIKSQKDENLLKELEELILDRSKRLRRVHIIIVLLYFAVYISIFSLLFSDLFFLSDFISLISEIISFFGTAVFLILIYFANNLKELYHSDLILMSSHIISIYNKYEPDSEVLFKESNTYNKFIDFLKKRGF